MVHRIATSQYYKSGLNELQTCWSLDDLFDATEVSDMLDALNVSD
jgi:hypothetical protein